MARRDVDDESPQAVKMFGRFFLGPVLYERVGQWWGILMQFWEAVLLCTENEVQMLDPVRANPRLQAAFLCRRSVGHRP